MSHYAILSNWQGDTPVALGQDRTTQTRGRDILVGGGINLNRHIGFLAEYTFDRFDIPDAAVTAFAGLQNEHADVHVWSLGGTAEYRYFATEHWGGYVLGRYGIFHRKSEISRFSACNGCAPSVMIKLDGASQPGFDVGGGFAFRLSDGSNVKLFAETRYVRTGNFGNSFAVLGAPVQQRQTFVPLRGGIRW